MANLTKEIGGHAYSIQPLPAMRAFILQPKLAPILSEIGRTLAQVAGSRGISLEMLGDTDVLDVLGATVTKLCEILTPKDLETITRELLTGATRDNLPLFTGQGDPFEVLMQGHTIEIWQILGLAVEANYPDFFGVIGGFVKKLKAESHSEGSTTSPNASPATV